MTEELFLGGLFWAFCLITTVGALVIAARDFVMWRRRPRTTSKPGLSKINPKTGRIYWWAEWW